MLMDKEKRSLIDNITARWTKDGIYVEMPEELFNELESILMERYGIDIEEALRQYFRWTIEKPVEFRKWVMMCRKGGTNT